MTNYVPSILESDVNTAVRAWLLSILPSGTPIIKGIPNRSAWPPANPGFVAMTLVRRKRLNYNIDSYDETAEDPTTWSSETHFEVTMQLDFIGVNAFDWCNVAETLWKDENACDALEVSIGGDNTVPGYSPSIDPLYTNDSIMIPLEDAEEQYEKRWLVEAVLQYNPVTTMPLQTADTLTVTVINVDEAYPP